MDKGQVLMQEISGLQSRLSRGEIIVDAPCGADPIVELLGGIHARASIEYTRPGRFPTVAQEFKKVTELIALIEKIKRPPAGAQLPIDRGKPRKEKRNVRQ